MVGYIVGALRQSPLVKDLEVTELVKEVLVELATGSQRRGQAK
jgi:hypothetical protein